MDMHPRAQATRIQPLAGAASVTARTDAISLAVRVADSLSSRAVLTSGQHPSSRTASSPSRISTLHGVASTGGRTASGTWRSAAGAGISTDDTDGGGACCSRRASARNSCRRTDSGFLLICQSPRGAASQTHDSRPSQRILHHPPADGTLHPRFLGPFPCRQPAAERPADGFGATSARQRLAHNHQFSFVLSSVADRLSGRVNSPAEFCPRWTSADPSRFWNSGIICGCAAGRRDPQPGSSAMARHRHSGSLIQRSSRRRVFFATQNSHYRNLRAGRGIAPQNRLASQWAWRELRPKQSGDLECKPRE